MSLDRDGGGHCVADVRIESRDKANGVLDVSPKLVPVGGDADDAAFFKGQESLAEVTDTLEKTVRDDRLERVELQLPCFGRERDRDIVADDFKGHLIDDLRDHRVHLAGHDR
jgi:hypothetical protein